MVLGEDFIKYKVLCSHNLNSVLKIPNKSIPKFAIWEKLCFFKFMNFVFPNF